MQITEQEYNTVICGLRQQLQLHARKQLDLSEQLVMSLQEMERLKVNLPRDQQNKSLIYAVNIIDNYQQVPKKWRLLVAEMLKQEQERLKASGKLIPFEI